MKNHNLLVNIFSSSKYNLYSLYDFLEENRKHDVLTSYYNSYGFGLELRKLNRKKLPISILSCDINGLKLINQSAGYNIGNKVLQDTASILAEQAPPTGKIFRIGGSHFSIVISNCDEIAINDIAKEILYSFKKYNYSVLAPVSIAVGSATTNRSSFSPFELFYQAECRMHNAKIRHQESRNNSSMNLLQTILGYYDQSLIQHHQRVENLSVSLAQVIGITGPDLDNISLLAGIHDVGKIGIPTSLLQKREKLNSQEYETIKKHSRIGYHIALQIPELRNSAEYILHHHEWWNGHGYPHGLSSTQIPFECRLVAVADAFDAMTNDRPYRKALPPETALIELKRMAGIQFDPVLVKNFIDYYHHIKTNISNIC